MAGQFEIYKDMSGQFRFRLLVDISLPVIREVEAAWGTHLGPARTSQLKETLTRLRDITDPFP